MIPNPMTPLDAGREARASRIRREFAVFEGLVGVAEDLLKASRLRGAAACAEIAGMSGWRNHPGLFVSTRLERLLLDLGRIAVPASSNTVVRPQSASPEHVLHVMSKARRMGGDSRFVCRWIQADGGRRHSVAITSQLDRTIPDVFVDSASRTGGRVHCLDADTRDPILRARRLRSLAENVDLVVLHLYPDDVVPLLAFAHTDALPPVALINHSDHTFWLGVNASDLVVQLRGCSIPLSVRRRHIDPERLAMLPIPLPPAERTLTRAEAKARLGLHPDTVVVLSVGDAFKFAPVDGPGFLEVLRPVIEKHEQAVLLTVGPPPIGEWAAACESTNGRIVPLGPRDDTASLFQAADVYLDPFPFTSPTAALEAGSYGLPVVAYCPRTGDGRVLCLGAPGLDESVSRHHDVSAYSTTVSRLIMEPDLRQEMGERARRHIEHHHTGTHWAEQLEDLYRVTSTIQPRAVQDHPDECEADEVDAVVYGLYTLGAQGLGDVIDQYVRPLPLLTRVAILRKMLRVNRSFSFDMFFPNWLTQRVSWRPALWKKARRLIAQRGVEPSEVRRCASV